MLHFVSFGFHSTSHATSMASFKVSPKVPIRYNVVSTLFTRMDTEMFLKKQSNTLKGMFLVLFIISNVRYAVTDQIFWEF